MHHKQASEVKVCEVSWLSCRHLYQAIEARGFCKAQKLTWNYKTSLKGGVEYVNLFNAHFMEVSKVDMDGGKQKWFLWLSMLHMYGQE